MDIGNKKTVKVAPGAGRRLKKDSLIVACLDPCVLLGSPARPVVDTTSSQSNICIVRSLGSPASLANDMMQWDCNGGLVYTLPTFEHEVLQDANAVSEFVTKLVHGGAFNNRDPSCCWLTAAAADEPIARALESVGFVDTQGPEGDLACAFTDRALEPGIMRCAWKLANPKPVLAPRGDLPVTDQTCYELLVSMFDAGWSWEPWLPGRKRDPIMPVGYTPGDRKRFLPAPRSSRIAPSYLMALLSAEDIGDSCMSMCR